MKIKIKAIKSGKMDRGDGKFFCYKDGSCTAEKLNDGEDYYEVQDELWGEPDWTSHCMDQKFFDKYFVEVKTERDIYYKKNLGTCNEMLDRIQSIK